MNTVLREATRKIAEVIFPTKNEEELICMGIFEKIGKVALGMTSAAGTVAIGYLTYRGVRDVLSAPNARRYISRAVRKGDFSLKNAFNMRLGAGGMLHDA